ncbi:MAG TPA: hypothetical protein VM689_00850 [Aliidongia sp.]|nr:hypothetical protein [Aliidongia sp.]
MMVTGREAADALGGVLRLAIFDRAGAAGFGRDARACARSFWSYLFGLPLILLLIGLQVAGTDTPTPALLGGAQFLAEIIGAAGFPLLLLPVLRRFGREDRWSWFVTGYNWFNLGQLVLILLVLSLLTGSPAPLGRIVLGLIQIYALVVEAFLAESILEIGGLRAAAIVLLDVLFGVGVGRIADWIGGAS